MFKKVELLMINFNPSCISLIIFPDISVKLNGLLVLFILGSETNSTFCIKLGIFKSYTNMHLNLRHDPLAFTLICTCS